MNGRNARLTGIRAVIRPSIACVLAAWLTIATVYTVGLALLRVLRRATNESAHLDALGPPTVILYRLHIVLIVVCLCAVVYTLVHWLCIRYEITHRAVRVSAGVVRRTHLTVQPDRIQDIVSHQTVFERLFGLATITITTASGRAAAMRSLDPWHRVERILRSMMRPGPHRVVLPSQPGPIQPTTRVRPVVIGIAGGIGSGKSTVAREFADLGCVVSDSDAQTRSLLSEQTTISTLTSWWGNNILAPDGTIDRAAVASIVFRDETQRKKLEQLIHPRLHAARAELIRTSMARAIVIDAPLLFEAGVDRECDAIVFVACPRETRLTRVRASRGWSDADLTQREDAQIPINEKRSRCRFVVENDDQTTPESRRAQIADVLNQIEHTVGENRR